MLRFNFKGTKIYIPDERVRYNEIRLNYVKVAGIYVEEFIKEYKKNNKNLDDVSNKAYNQGAIFIALEIERTVENLIKNKMYSINDELFLEKYCQETIEIWNNAYNKINDQYMDIVLDKKQKEEYRRYRKNSRGKWIGGGFGVGGAIKGNLQAAGMNMLTGAAHTAVNFAGNLGSSMKANKEKEKIFNNPTTLKILENGLYNAILNIHYAYINFLEDEYNLRFKCVYQREANEAEIIFSNIKDRNLNNREKIELIKKIINLNPYFKQIYEYAISNLGDENNEISRIANYFGYDMYEYKLGIIKRKRYTLKTTSEEETMITKEILLKEVRNLGLENNISDIKEIKLLEQKLNDFDKMARTVEDIVFKTRKEANIVRENKNKIKKIVENMNKDDENSLLDARLKIIKIGCKLESTKEILKEIDNKLDYIDKEERTVNDILFETRDEANLAREEKIKIDKLVENLDLNSENSIKQVKTKIESEEFKTEISKLLLDKLNNRLKEIDIEKRTVNGILFESRDKANLAREEKVKIDKLVENLDLNSEESIKQAEIKIESEEFKTEVSKSLLDELNNRLKEIDVEKRTVDNILFKTREEANLAREEKIKAEKIYNSININDIKSLMNAKKQFTENVFSTEIVDKYKYMIDKYIQNIYDLNIKTAKEHYKNKKELRSDLLSLLVVVFISIFLFTNVGTFFKFIIVLFLFGGITSYFESLKKVRESKKSLKKIKKIEKSLK